MPCRPVQPCSHRGTPGGNMPDQFPVATTVSALGSISAPSQITMRIAGERLSESITWVDVLALRSGDSPRLEGLSEDHIHALIEAESDFPPIIVHRATMCVIDGMHRVEAARLAGREQLPVRFFEGDEEEAFLL